MDILFILIMIALSALTIAFIWLVQPVRIGQNEVGIMIKKFSLNSHQPRLPSHQQIALQGEVGVQADILPPGQHWRYWSWLYTIRKVPLIKVPPGEIGLVVARDGLPIPLGRQLGRVVDCHDFQDARAFLTNGGQKGPQMGILTAGEYRINTALFDVVTSSTIEKYNGKPRAEDLRVYTIDRDKIGIVTTFDGAPLPAGEIAAPIIFGHDHFQNGQEFIDVGGYKGLQEDILSAGAYNLNPWFVKVKQVRLLRIPAGTVGVIISNVGIKLNKYALHDLVEDGYKGIWKTPLYPGHHAINTEVMSVVIVPTNPIVLEWSNQEKSASNLDAKLRALILRSRDGFLFEIELTQIIRIEAENAPQMILNIGTREAEVTDQMVSNDADSAYKRYSSIRNLVTKVLEPTIENYFRNSAQGYDALDFHDERIERQEEAKVYINAALSQHGIQGVDTLINEIDLPYELERILQERKIVDEERENYQRKLLKEEAKQLFISSEAKFQVELARLKAEGEIHRTKAEAEVIRQRAEAEAKVIETLVRYLGPEGYLEKGKIEQLADVKLPDTVYGHDGWLDALMTRMLANGRDQQAPNENNPEWLEKLIDFVNSNPTIFMAIKSFSDSHTPNNLVENLP